MTVSSFQEANVAILNVYTNWPRDWTPFQEEKFLGIATAVIPPEKVSHFVEFAFAQADALSVEAKEIAAEVAIFAASHGFYGLGEDQRGFRIAAFLRGETVADLPEVKAEWIEAAPVAEAEVPAPVAG